jgi:hypothetical protein
MDIFYFLHIVCLLFFYQNDKEVAQDDKNL